MDNKELQNVKITGLDIPFFNLANFVLKLYFAWLLATIIMLPIIFIISLFVFIIFGN